jgi:hypothetical protein
MFRCVPKAGLATAVLLLAAGATSQAVAQTSRPFPATALRGALQITQPPDVLLNGEAARLSPGSRIRGANNMLQMSGALVGQNLLVHYTREMTGLVHDVWILTPEEAARKPWPTTADEARRWEFNPAAQTWTRKWAPP